MYEIFERLMREHDVTAYRVAKDVGISQSSLSEWKYGRSRPKYEKLLLIADYFGVGVEHLLGEKPLSYNEADFIARGQEHYAFADYLRNIGYTIYLGTGEYEGKYWIEDTHSNTTYFLSFDNLEEFEKIVTAYTKFQVAELLPRLATDIEKSDGE